ncbi:MAG: hypothetical protein ABL953_02475 [Ilumatobacteraceae bacterium]
MRSTVSLLLVISVIAGCNSSEESAASDETTVDTTDNSAPDDEMSPYELFSAAVGEAPVTAQQALDWFVSLTGLNVPGSEPTFGRVSGPVLLDASLNQLVEHWNEYSAEQQAALVELLRVVDSPAPDDTEGAAAAPRAGLVRSVTAVDPALQALVVPVNDEVGRLLGSTLNPSTIVLQPINAELVGTAHAEANSGSELFGWRPSSDCTIVYGRAFSRATITQQRALLAHEISHCHVFSHASVPDVAGLPKWYFEGSASWVGEVIGQGSGADLVGGFWRTFLAGNATLPTGDRGYSFLNDRLGYSAIGVFQWAAERQGVATIGRSIIANLKKSTEEKLEFLFGTPGTPQREALLSSFATSPVRRPFGPSWQFTGIGLGSFGIGGVGRKTVDHTLATDVELRLQLADGGRIGTAALTITPTADVDLVHLAIVGYGKVNWNGEGEVASEDGSIDQVYCVGEACRCAESLRDRTDVIPLSEGATAVVALSADAGMPIRVAAKGYHLADGSCDPCPAAGPSRATHSGALVYNANALPAGSDPICSPDTTLPVDETCLVGAWTVDNAVMATAFQALTNAAGGPAGTQVVTGSFSMQVNADGTMAITVVDWTTAGEEAGPAGTPPVLFESVFNGATTGTWTADATSFTTATTGIFGGRAFITIAGTRSEITGVPLANLPVGNGTSSYVCTPEGGLVLRARVRGGVDLTFTRTG